MSDEIATLLAQRFIARRDAKAIQMANGDYHLHTVDGKRDSARLPWKMGDLRAHLAGVHTYGHYLLDEDSKCKLFAFDIDLEKTGFLPVDAGGDSWKDWELCSDLRSEWLNRRSPHRWLLKYQLKYTASKIAERIECLFNLPVAVAYSGSKGVHVYAFTGPIMASEAREGAEIVLDDIGQFKLAKGNNFYKWENEDPETGFPNISIEIFPKQSRVNGKDGLGNLMRLPLGRNRKSKDPTFFLDMRSPMSDFSPIHAGIALGGNKSVFE